MKKCQEEIRIGGGSGLSMGRMSDFILLKVKYHGIQVKLITTEKVIA
jgi:hypothetical protein